MNDISSMSSDDRDIEVLARDIVRIERQCFYGDEPERDRLRKIREKLNNEIVKKSKAS